MSYTAGTVWLDVVPSFDNLQRTIAREVSGIGKTLGAQIDLGIEDGTRDSDKHGTTAANKFAGAFNTRLQAQLRKAQESLPDLEVRADTSDAAADLDALQARIKAFKGLKVDADIDGKGALAQAAILERELEAIMGDIDADIDLRFDASQASKAMRAFREEIDAGLNASTDRQRKAQEKQARETIALMRRQAAEQAAIAKAARAAQEKDGRDTVAILRRQAAERDALRKASERAELLAAKAERAAQEAFGADYVRSEKRRMDERGAYFRQMTAGIATAIRALPDIEIDADSTDAQREIAEIRAALRTIQTASLRVDFDTGAATAELMALSARLRALDGKDVDIQVDADVAAALVGLRAVDREVTKLERKGRLIEIGQAANSFRLFSGALLTVVSVGPLVIPVIAGITAAVGALGAVVGAVVLGIGALGLAFSGIGGAVSALNEADKQARQSPGGGTGTPKTAKDTRGLRDAQLALDRAREDAGLRIADAKERERKAEQALADAVEDGTRRIARAQATLASSQKALAQAQEDAMDRAERAVATRERAEERVQETLERSRNAEKALTDAREAAARAIEDLNNKLIDTRNAQRQATLDVEEKGVALGNISSDPQATAREKEVAQLAYDEAVQSLRELQIETKRLEDDTTSANAAGVDGHALVLRAEQQRVDSIRAVTDAQRALADAIKDQSDVAIDNAERVAEARQRAADAEAALGEAEKERIRDIADARKAVADAAKDTARARVLEARTIADAERRVADAMVDMQEKSVAAGAAGSTAMDNLAEAMGSLPQSGQDFARFLFSLKPLLDDLREAASDGFLPGLQEAISIIVEKYGEDFIDFIGTMAELLGDLAVAGAEALTDPFWVNFFETMAEYAPQLLTQFAQIGGAIVTTLAAITEAFAPFSAEFGDALVAVADVMAEWAKGLAGSTALEDFLTFVRTSGPKVLGILGNLVTMLINLGIGMEPYIDDLLGVFQGITDFLANLSPEVISGIALGIIGVIFAIQALAGMMAAFTSVATLIAGIVAIGGTLALTIGAIVLLLPLAVAAIVGFILGIVWVINAIKDWYTKNTELRKNIDTVFAAIGGTFNFFKGIFMGVFGAIVSFLEMFVFPIFEMLWSSVISPIFGFIIGIWQTILSVWTTVWNAVSQVVTKIIAPIFTYLYEKIIKPIWEQYIQPVFDAIGSYIEDTVAPAFQAGIDLIGKIWATLKNIFTAPIRFFIETVLNKGLIDNFNKLADVFPGITPIKHVDVPAGLANDDNGFADGGVLPGYSPGRDIHTFTSPTGGRLHLSGGEGILIPELTSVIGKSRLMRANRAARSGRRREAMGLLGGSFAGGGVIGDAASWIGDKAGDIGNWFGDKARDAGDWLADKAAALGTLITDPGKFFSDLIEGLFGDMGDSHIVNLIKSAPGVLIDSIVDIVKGFVGGGQDEAKGPLSDGGGWRWMQDTLRDVFPSINFSSAYRPGAKTLSGSTSYHALGRAVDIAPPSMKVFNWLEANFPNSRGLLYTPAGPGRQIIEGRKGARVGPGTAAMHYNHIHWAYRDGGIVPKLYDEGGALPPGLSVVMNKTGKPEQVLTSAQMDKLANGRGGAGPGVAFHGDFYSYDPRDVSAEMAKRLRDANALAGINSIGVRL